MYTSDEKKTKIFETTVYLELIRVHPNLKTQLGLFRFGNNYSKDCQSYSFTQSFMHPFILPAIIFMPSPVPLLLWLVFLCKPSFSFCYSLYFLFYDLSSEMKYVTE